MITFKLTAEQAKALHQLLSAAHIEPELIERPLLNVCNPLTDHILWPVLADSRQQIQLAYLKAE